MVEAIGILVFGGIAFTMLTGGAPLLILGHWVESRCETKKLLAEARVLELKIAAGLLPVCSPPPARGRDDADG